MAEPIEFDWIFDQFDLELLEDVAKVLLRFAIAVVLVLPLAWDREQSQTSAGLRTFPLVAIASCAFAIIGVRAGLHDSSSLGRSLQGVITGIGFIGGGAILKSGEEIQGTATAASVWSTGAIGVAVGLGSIDVAIVLGLVNFIAFKWGPKLKRHATASRAAEEDSGHGGDE